MALREAPGDRSERLPSLIALDDLRVQLFCPLTRARWYDHFPLASRFSTPKPSLRRVGRAHRVVWPSYPTRRRSHRAGRLHTWPGVGILSQTRVADTRPRRLLIHRPSLPLPGSINCRGNPVTTGTQTRTQLVSRPVRPPVSNQSWPESDKYRSLSEIASWCSTSTLRASSGTCRAWACDC